MRRSPRTLFCAIALLGSLTGCADKAVETIQQGETNSCAADQKVIETAVETYYANGGVAGTAAMPALVGAGLLREASRDFTVAPDGYSVIPIPGGLCDAGGGTAAPAAGGSLTAEQCEADRLTLQRAVDAFGAAYSVSPMDENELVRAQLLTAEVPGYDLQGSTVVPVEGACA